MVFNKIIFVFGALLCLQLSAACVNMAIPDQQYPANNSDATNNSNATIEALNSAIEALQESQKKESEKTKVDDWGAKNRMIIEVPTPTPVKKYMVATATPVVSLYDKAKGIFENDYDIADRIIDAQGLRMGGQVKESIRLCSKILEDILESKDPELELLVNLYDVRARAYADDEQYQNAVDDLILAKDLLNGKSYYPSFFADAITYTVVLSNLGHYYTNNLEDYEKSLTVLNELIDFDPEFAYGWAQRGMVYVELDEFRLGLEDIEKAKSFGPLTNYADKIFYYSGVALFELGELELGNFDYDKSHYFQAIGEFNKAEAVLTGESGIDINYIRYQRGWTNLRLQKLSEAESDLVQVTEDSGLYESALNGLGSIHKKQLKYDLALKSYDELIRMAPFESMYYSNRGNVHYEKEDYMSALRDYDKAIELGSDWPPTFYNRGIILEYELNEYTAASKDYAEACRLDRNYCD